jgi:uncharacterized protein (TIGR02217 family)
MAFINARLPIEVEIGAVVIDDEDVEIVPVDGGGEHRNVRASQSLRQIDLSYPHSQRDAANYLAVHAMYKVARKSLYGFRFQVFSDHTLTDEVIGEGDYETDEFQITKTYEAGSDSHVRRITRPVSPTVVVKLDSVTQVSGYSVNYDTGVITFADPPGLGVEISVSCEFDIPVRFDGPFRNVGVTPELDHIEGITLQELRE